MQIIIGATILGIIVHSGKYNFKKLYNREIFLLFWIYIGAILSIIFSEYDLPKQYYYANELLKIAILCSFIILLVDSPEKLVKYEKFLMYGTVFLAVWGIDQHFRGNARLEKLGGFDSNGIAAFFALFAPLALSQLVEARNVKERGAGIFSLFSIIIAIIFTQSRGGLLGLIAGTVTYIYHSNKKKQITAAILLVCLLASPFISKSYTKRMDTMTSEDKLGGSAKSRIDLWKMGLMIFKDHPVLGTGLLSFPLEKFKYEKYFTQLDPDYRDWLFRRNIPKVTHNTYIKFLSDSGLVTALPFFLLIAGTFLANRKIRKKFKHSCEANKSISLLTAIECGIVGNCVSIMFIDANFIMVFLYVQIVVCSLTRGLVNSRESKLNKATR
jgi:O-antigen ligase